MYAKLQLIATKQAPTKNRNKELFDKCRQIMDNAI